MNRRHGAAAALFAPPDERGSPPLRRVALAGEPSAQWLAIRAGGQRLALRLADIEGLHADRRIIPLPAAPPELLGLTGIRGRPIAAYDMSALTRAESRGPSRAAPPPGPPPRWLAVCRADPSVGLAFDAVDGYLEAPSEGAVAAAEAGGLVRERLRSAGEPRGVLSVPALLAELSRRAGLDGAAEPP
jgi:purine-binding chemotaxis protein CheW